MVLYRISDLCASCVEMWGHIFNDVGSYHDCVVSRIQ